MFISELCPDFLKQPLVFLTELLAAIPSIVYGLWAIFVLVPIVRSFELNVPEPLQWLPLFNGPPLGVGMLSAALILAVMVVPFTSSVAREVLKSIAARPGTAYASARRVSSDRRRAVLRQNRNRGGSHAGFGRAIGEKRWPSRWSSATTASRPLAFRSAAHDSRKSLPTSSRKPIPICI